MIEFEYICRKCHSLQTYLSRVAKPKRPKARCRKCRKIQYVFKIAKAFLEPTMRSHKKIESSEIMDGIKDDMQRVSSVQKTHDPSTMYSVHHLSFKIPYYSLGRMKADKIVKMKNWEKKIYKIGKDITLSASNTHAIFTISAKIYCYKPNFAIIQGKKLIIEAMHYMEQFGMRFDYLHLGMNSKPHIVFPQNFTGQLGQLGKGAIIRDSQGNLQIDDSDECGGHVELLGLEALETFFALVNSRSETDETNNRYA